MRVLVEGCVTSVEEAVRSASAGAGRLELCESLDVGGLTPELDLVAEVVEAVDIPVFTMVRPRPGDFIHDRGDIEHMVSEVASLRAAGASGMVAGVLDRDGLVNPAAMRALVEAARPLPVTFHRAFDMVPDMPMALDALISIGVARVLTSGGTAEARDGVDGLADLVRRSGGRISVMAGGRVRGDHVSGLVRAAGVTEIHARAEAIPALIRALRAM